MISSVLPYVEGSDEDRKLRRLAFANKIAVTTKQSLDGRSLESLYIDYSPTDGYAVFLMEDVLNTSEGVKSYSIYNEVGVRITDFNKQRFPKRI